MMQLEGASPDKAAKSEDNFSERNMDCSGLMIYKFVR